MKRLSSKFISVFLALLIALSWVLVAMAAPVNIVLEKEDRADGSGNLTVQGTAGNPFVDDDGSGKFFYYVENMLPGYDTTQTYPILNRDTDHAYDLWFRTEDAMNWFRSQNGRRLFVEVDRNLFKSDPDLDSVTLEDLKVGGRLYGLKVDGLKQGDSPANFTWLDDGNTKTFTLDDLKGILKDQTLYDLTLNDLKAGGRLYGLKVNGLTDVGSAPATFTRNGQPFTESNLKEFLREHRLLAQLNLELFYNDKKIYEGRMDGTGSGVDGNGKPYTGTNVTPYIPPTPQNVIEHGNGANETAIYLGRVAAGRQDIVISARVSLPGETTKNEYQSMGGQITWVFIARRIEGGTPTTTGGGGGGSPSTRPPSTRPPSTSPPTSSSISPGTPTDPTTPSGGTSVPPGGSGTPPGHTPTPSVRPKPPSPITGDTARQVFYMIATLVSVVAFVVILAVMRRRKGTTVRKRK